MFIRGAVPSSFYSRRPRPSRSSAWLISWSQAPAAFFSPALLPVGSIASTLALALIVAGGAILGVLVARYDLANLERAGWGSSPRQSWLAMVAPIYLAMRGRLVEVADERAFTPMWFSIVSVPCALTVGWFVAAIAVKLSSA